MSFISKDPEFLELLRDAGVLQTMVEYKAKRKAAQAKADYEFAMKLQKATTFEITLVYLDKRADGSYCEYFEMEGIENAMMIFNEYRRIGFSLRLRYIEIHIKDADRIKRVNFKY